MRGCVPVCPNPPHEALVVHSLLLTICPLTPPTNMPAPQEYLQQRQEQAELQNNLRGAVDSCSRLVRR
jgi:hypothetical protein